MTSTESLPNSSLTEETPPTDPPENQPPRTPEEELQYGLRTREGIKRLIRMRSLKSISDGMDWETEAVATQTKLDEEVIRGDLAASSAPPAAAKPADDAETDMQEWVAGDKTTIVHNYPVPTEPKAAATTPAPAAETKPAGLLPTLAIAAATLVGGAGLGYVASEAMKPDAPATQDFQDTDTKTDVAFPQ